MRCLSFGSMVLNKKKVAIIHTIMMTRDWELALYGGFELNCEYVRRPLLLHTVQNEYLHTHID